MAEDVVLIDNSKQVLDAMTQKVGTMLWTIGAVAEGFAKDELYAPKHGVDTGRLRNSISHSEDMKEEAVYIGTNVKYAKFIELGTKNFGGLHYLQKACTEHNDDYKQIAESILKQ